MTRAALYDLVANITPLDERERADQLRVLSWIDSGAPLYRTAKPATPPMHLVSYALLVDGEYVLLVDHINAELWLPNGGHVDVNEYPHLAAHRELTEELGVSAPLLAAEPIMITVTKTVGKTAGHTDVSLWFAFCGDRTQSLTCDENEFNEARCFHRDVIPYHRADPEMRRFMNKLAAIGSL